MLSAAYPVSHEDFSWSPDTIDCRYPPCLPEKLLNVEFHWQSMHLPEPFHYHTSVQYRKAGNRHRMQP